MHTPNAYETILQRKIDEGAAKAGSVIEAIHTQQPKDQIVSTRGLAFSARANRIGIHVGQDIYAPSDYALGQLAGRAGVPPTYLRELALSKEEWQRELASDILGRHFHYSGSDRLLVRSVNGQVRGVLSDRFRRLDSRPLVDALATEAQAFGAVPIDGTFTETRVALKVLLPTILEPIPGEYMVYGLEWSNSDYGNGTNSIRAFALRVVCLNGMTRENLLREIHLGGRLTDDVSYSDRTYRLDTAASVSALRDVVRGALGPKGQSAMTAALVASNGRAMSAAQLKQATRNVGKETQKSIVDAFESLDVINLPAGESAWRASNAVSWVARHTDDAEKRLDLERIAGSLA